MRRIFASTASAVVLFFCGLVADVQGQNRPAGDKVGSTKAGATLPLTLPNKDNSVRFMVVGDTGTGTRQHHELADLMLRYRQQFPYEFALLMGDNMYGSEKAADYKSKFEDVYRPLLSSGVKFYASLGNHDESVVS